MSICFIIFITLLHIFDITLSSVFWNQCTSIPAGPIILLSIGLFSIVKIFATIFSEYCINENDDKLTHNYTKSLDALIFFMFGSLCILCLNQTDFTVSNWFHINTNPELGVYCSRTFVEYIMVRSVLYLIFIALKYIFCCWLCNKEYNKAIMNV